MARSRVVLSLTLALLAAEVFLLFSPPLPRPAAAPRRSRQLPPTPTATSTGPPARVLPEHGTLTAPCTQNSAYVDERIAWLWERTQAGEDWAAQCCLCMDCHGGDARNEHTCNSQFGQDLFLYRNFFRCLPEPGAYVDVGAHHPKQLSSTYFFDVCLGWTKGLCVEASRSYAGLLADSRSCAVAQAAAAAGDGGTLRLGAAGARSETSSEGRGEVVRAATLATLLREANFTIGDGKTGEEVIIDLVSVDVEGDELAALLGMPWDSVWARIIMVENVKASQDVFEFLMDKGYIKFATLSVDDFYYKVSGVPFRTPSNLGFQRMSTAAMRKTELSLETYETPVLYTRQWEHLRIMHAITHKIPTE